MHQNLQSLFTRENLHKQRKINTWEQVRAPILDQNLKLRASDNWLWAQPSPDETKKIIPSAPKTLRAK